MVIYHTLEEAEISEATSVALGNFDGVHLGHQKLISENVKYANENGLIPAVFTFSTHPRNLLKYKPAVKNILYRSEKEKIMESLGVEIMVEVPFTEEIMKLSPDDFVKNLLVDKMKARSLFCGFNFSYGYRAGGDPALLKKQGEEFGFTVHEMPPYIIHGNVVSSTLIRTLVASGQVDHCKMYMGRYYEIAGEVVVGNRIGRKIGYPTSNLVIDESMVTPPNGVYATYCVYNGVRYPSVTNVGVKPTIGEYNKNVETHIFNFNRELYGKRIIVEFLKKQRDEVKFDSVEDLADQIIRDCKEAQEYHEALLKEKVEK